MTKHMTLNKKFALSTEVLEGKSFAQVAKQFNISKAGAAKIFNATKHKIFPLIYEREQLGIDIECVESMKSGWLQIKGYL